MDVFEFYKIIKVDKAQKCFAKLEKIYKKIPETKGCLKNINEENSCGGWCCHFQSSQLLYIEFLYAWQKIIGEWGMGEIATVIEAAMRNYVMGFATKGCIFFDKETKMCKIHKVRNLNCRIYGITPKEEFTPRYERMKEKYKNVIGAVIKDQCDLVSICNGKKITTSDTDKWWKAISKLEKKIGIPEKNINDDMGGSYRTYHDHLLLYLMTDDIMLKLQGVRLSTDHGEKLMAIDQFMTAFKNKIG